MLMKFSAAAVVFVLVFAMASAQDKTEQTNTDKPKTDAQKEGKMNTVVVMKTSMGSIKIELNDEKAPVTVKNFLGYVDAKFYDNTVFHRVIKGFMIQAGGFDATSPIKQKKTKDPIVNEGSNGLKNERGTLSMARTNDPNSATSQFFINLVDNTSLNASGSNAGYAVFGKVIEGMDVVDKIAGVATTNAKAIARSGDQEIETTFQNVPQTNVVVESVRRLGGKK